MPFDLRRSRQLDLLLWVEQEVVVLGILGADVLFFVFEAGFNYGFNDLFKNEKGNPGEFFVNIGFRF